MRTRINISSENNSDHTRSESRSFDGVGETWLSKKVIFGGDRGKNVPFKCGQIALEKGRNSTHDYKWHRKQPSHGTPRGPRDTSGPYGSHPTRVSCHVKYLFSSLYRDPTPFQRVCRPNGFLGLSLNDRTILFLVISLDKTVSVG